MQSLQICLQTEVQSISLYAVSYYLLLLWLAGQLLCMPAYVHIWNMV